MSQRLFPVFFAIVTLFLLTPGVSSANSDSVSISASATLVYTPPSLDWEEDENGNFMTVWWKYAGNPNDYLGQFVIVVTAGSEWNYDKYTYSLNEPNYVYHVETFDPENFLFDKDPYGEAAYASLSHVEHYTDFFHFADPEEVMVASGSGAGLIDESVIKNTLVRSIM